MAPPRRKFVPAAALWAVWHDQEMSNTEVARSLGISVSYLYWLARHHHMPRRAQTRRAFSMAEPEPEEGAAIEPQDDLSLCPWVARRIAELQIKERHYAERRAERDDWRPVA